MDISNSDKSEELSIYCQFKLMLKLGICYSYTMEEAKKIKREAKDESLIIILKEDPKKKFWDNRMFEIRRWNWCCLASNVIF